MWAPAGAIAGEGLISASLGGRMYCTHCGGEHDLRATACPDCGRPIDYPPAPDISNYFVPALLATICCCPPFGAVAIIFSALVNSRMADGDVAGAQRASTHARTWTIIAFATAALLLGGFVLLALLNR